MSIIIANMPMCPECGYYLTKRKSDVENYCARCGYTVVQNKTEQARLQRYQASGSDAPAPVPDYERCG